MTDKIKNYTDEMTAMILAEYMSEPTRTTVDALAEKTGKTVRSLIAKLSREGVYKKIERKTKTGVPVITKTELVKKINAHYGFEVNSLVKATKMDLQKMVDSFAHEM